MHDQRDRILKPWFGVGQRKIENALGFGVHRPRDIEALKIDPGRCALVRLGCCCSGKELMFPRKEIFGLIFAPLNEIENRSDGSRSALRSGCSRGQRQAAGTRQNDSAGSDFGGHVIGGRTYRDAVDRLEERKLDKILSLRSEERRVGKEWRD